MDQGRYSMTLDDIPPWISRVVRKGVPYGYASRTVKPGYLLTDGTALLESERDENGFYTGGAGMDGMYLRTGALYEPVLDEKGAVKAFRKMDRFLSLFTGEEQKLIFQYALNTPEHLIEDLTAALPACVRLMADIHAAYKGRAEQTIRERQNSAHKATKRKRGMER